MFEYEIYKLKGKHKEYITLGEFKNTLDNALQLTNILFDKAINDILEVMNNNDNYLYRRFKYMLYSTYEYVVIKDIYEILSLTYNTNTNIEEEYNLNIKHYNIDLFKDVMKKLNNIKSIIYKGESSDVTLTTIDVMTIHINFDSEKTKLYLTYIDTIKITDKMKWLDMPKLENEPITLYTGKKLTKNRKQ